MSHEGFSNSKSFCCSIMEKMIENPEAVTAKIEVWDARPGTYGVVKKEYYYTNDMFRNTAPFVKQSVMSPYYQFFKSGFLFNIEVA